MSKSIRTTFYIEEDLHKALKTVSAKKDRSMSEIINEKLKRDKDIKAEMSEGKK